MKIESEDYLWDGSGEPDPDIQELESILGTLRHKGSAPKLPVRSSSPYRLSSMLAIAASILLVAGAGYWVTVHLSAKRITTVATVAPQPRNNSGDGSANSSKDKTVAVNSPPPEIPRVVSGGEKQKPMTKRASVSRDPMFEGLTAQEIREGQDAKARVMLAMEIASSKLNEARKKVQDESRLPRS